MLVYFEPAAMCNMPTDLLIAPLPAKKQLWEADDEHRWKAQNATTPDIQTLFGLAADGELVKLDGTRSYCVDATVHFNTLDTRSNSGITAEWEEWCSGMDGFGGLIMLAASSLTSSV